MEQIERKDPSIITAIKNKVNRDGCKSLVEWCKKFNKSGNKFIEELIVEL